MNSLMVAFQVASRSFPRGWNVILVKDLKQVLYKAITLVFARLWTAALSMVHNKILLLGFPAQSELAKCISFP